MALFRNPLKSLFSANQPVRQAFPLPAPAKRCFFVGDLHGRDDLLQKILAETRADRLDNAADLVFLGDMIDRGPESANVITQLHRLSISGRAICLLGNHERMMLDFLDDPDKKGDLWFHNGGVETLASFGLDTNIGAASDLAEGLRNAMPDGLENWLRDLPLQWTSGNITATHAGADPSKPLEMQSENALIWGHPDFLKNERQDGHWIAHGHVIFDAPTAAHGRISVDTGAWQTGVLSAARLEDGAISFLQVADRG